MSMDWARADMNPDDPGSQGYSPPQFCGISHPNIDNGAPCVKKATHPSDEIKPVIHLTANGFWWEEDE